MNDEREYEGTLSCLCGWELFVSSDSKVEIEAIGWEHYRECPLIEEK